MQTEDFIDKLLISVATKYIPDSDVSFDNQINNDVDAVTDYCTRIVIVRNVLYDAFASNEYYIPDLTKAKDTIRLIVEGVIIRMGVDKEA